MLLVGLTGGIGSGKSTVARLLAERGAVIVDADDLAREAVAPGTPGLVKIVDHFGRDVLLPDGSLDRAAVAAIVFGDPEARRRLESIVHPEVGRRFAERLEPYRGTSAIVVYVVPLLVEGGLQPIFDIVVTVSADEEVRVGRMVRDRGMPEASVRDRMRAQASDEERERAAAFVIRNDGTPGEMEGRVDELWAELGRRAEAAG